jgi:hypothetical protein
VPAAAVIPAPIAYINVVAVKKLVVGFLQECLLSAHVACAAAPLHPSVTSARHSLAGGWLRIFTLRKLECFRQA